MQGNKWDFSKRMLELDMEKMSLLAESHWDKIDRIVFSGVGCYLVEAEVFSALCLLQDWQGIHARNKEKKKEQVKMCAEHKRAEQSQWDANCSEI